jgi:hypothetical protein
LVFLVVCFPLTFLPITYKRSSSTPFALHVPPTSSFSQRIRPGSRLFLIFRNKLVFYGEGLLAKRPTPKLEDHPLSFVRGCIFNTSEAPFHPQPEDAPCCGDKGTHVRSEVFTAVTMKKGIFWDVTPRGSCKNRRFGEPWRLRNVGSYKSHMA